VKGRRETRPPTRCFLTSTADLANYNELVKLASGESQALFI